jgi:hypothetical protein
VAIQLGIGSPEVLSAINNLDDVESTLQTAHEGVDQGLAQVESNMNAVMDTLHNDFRDPSYSFENTWRFVVIAVLFGLNIVSSLMAGAFSIQVGRPIFASFSVALLWFTVTLLMLFGVGLLRGVVVVSTDACLYTETFMRGLVQTRVTNLERREFVSNTLGDLVLLVLVKYGLQAALYCRGYIWKKVALRMIATDLAVTFVF